VGSWLRQQRSTTLASLVNNGSNRELDGLELDWKCTYSFFLHPATSIGHSRRREASHADTVMLAILLGILLLTGCLLVRKMVWLATQVDPFRACLELVSFKICVCLCLFSPDVCIAMCL
jgi:hypothetical protein